MYAIDKKIEWTTGSGKQATVAIRLQTSRIVDADGDRCEVPCCDLSITADVAGMGIMSYGIDRLPATVAGVVYPARAGRLAIPAAQLAEIDAVLAGVYATPEWQAKQQAAAKAKIANREYDERREFMRQQMGY